MGLFDLFKRKKNIDQKNVDINTDVEELELEKNEDEHPYSYVGWESKYNRGQVTALFLHSVDYSCQVKENEQYPRYMTYEYKISNVKKFHQELIVAGYFQTSSFDELLVKLKVTELKEIASEKSVNISKMKKADIIDTLIKELDQDFKDEYCRNSGFYVLSQKGKDYVSNYSDFLTLYENRSTWNISYNRYLTQKNANPKMRFNDIIWGLLNEKRMEEYAIGNFIGVRVITYSMADFLRQENNQKDYLYYLLETIWYDASLVHVQTNLYQHLRKGIFDRDYLIECLDLDSLASGIINQIYTNSDYYDVEMVNKLYHHKLLPYKFVEKEEFESMIKDIFESSFFEEDKYMNLFRTRAKKEIVNRTRK